MKNYCVLLRIPALFLSIALGAPAPVLALRPLNAGSEESPTRTTLSERISPAAGAEEQPTGRRKWTVEKVVEVIGRAAASKRPKLSLASGAIVSKAQRGSALGAELFHAYAAVVINKSFPDDLPDWPAALRKAGEDSEKIYQNESWTVEKVLGVIRRAAASKRPKLSLAPGAIQSKAQRARVLGAKLFHAYTTVVMSKSFPDDLPDWPSALRAAGEDPANHYRRRGFAASAEEKPASRHRWTVERVVGVIRRAAASKRPKLSLAPGAIESESQRGSGLGTKLYRAYVVVRSKSFPEDLPDWPAALRAAGEDPANHYRRGFSAAWTVEKVLGVIRRAAASKHPKLSLAPGAIVSKSQRRSALGAELSRAYAAAVGRKSFPEDLPDWRSALRAAGQDPDGIYEYESWTVEKVVGVIRHAAASKRPKLSLAPGAIKSESQRGSGLGTELYRAYVAAKKSFPEDFPDWPSALRAAGEDPANHYRRGFSAAWTVEKVLGVIRRAAASKHPKLSLAPGAIESESQRGSGLGTKLYRAYVVVRSKSFPEDFPDWPSALRAAGEDPANHYRRGFSAAGAEEIAVERSLAVAREAVQGPGVVVIDAAMFPEQTGLEEFLARLPVDGRFIVVGAESAAGLEAHARNPAVIVVAGPEDAATVILALRAREKVYVFGGIDLTRLLQLYLRDFLIEVSQIDLRLGLKGILLVLGVPEDLLRQLDWTSVESALSSLEAA